MTQRVCLLWIGLASLCEGGQPAKHEAVLLRFDTHVATGVVASVGATIDSQLGLSSKVVFTNLQVKAAEDVVVAAGKSTSPSGEIVVVVVQSPVYTNLSLAVFPPQRVVVINAVNRGVPGKRDGSDADSSLRAVQRKVVQGVGRLAGMAPCPNPLCAMCVRVQSHDARQAVGFCPICTSSFRKHLKAMGYKHRYDRLAEEAAEKGMTTNRPASTSAVTLPPGPAPSPSK